VGFKAGTACILTSILSRFQLPVVGFKVKIIRIISTSASMFQLPVVGFKVEIIGKTIVQFLSFSFQ